MHIAYRFVVIFFQRKLFIVVQVRTVLAVFSIVFSLLHFIRRSRECWRYENNKKKIVVGVKWFFLKWRNDNKKTIYFQMKKNRAMQTRFSHLEVENLCYVSSRAKQKKKLENWKNARESCHLQNVDMHIVWESTHSFFCIWMSVWSENEAEEDRC